MKTQQTTRGRKRMLIFGIALVLLVYFTVIFISQEVRIRENKARIAELEQERAAVEEDIDALRKEIESADSRETIEQYAHENGFLYPDETKYVDTNNG